MFQTNVTPVFRSVIFLWADLFWGKVNNFMSAIRLCPKKWLHWNDKAKGKAFPVQAWTGPQWVQKVEAPRILRQLAH